MLKSTAAMAGATLISRVLGLVREMVYARFMGNGWVASAFLLAYQIPNLFRRLLGEGALTAAFIPVFKDKETHEGEAAMWRSANAVISGLILAASIVVGLAIFIVSLALRMGDFDSQTRLMLELLRIMFPYTLLVCLAAICMGMLNARGRFFIPALGAAILNVVLIATVLWIAPRAEGRLPQQIHVVAYGVLAAGLAQAAFQMPALVRDGWRYRWVAPWRDDTVMTVVRRMLPATIGVAAFQLNVVITQGFAFFLGETIVASFQYAVRLMEFPQGLFGASLATYLLPTLSGLASQKRFDQFRATLLRGLTILVVANLFASAMLAVLARPIVRLLFEGGVFQESATDTVAFALVLLAPGLVAFSATGIVARAFFAMGDTRVPMQISVFCLGLNTILSILFAMALDAGGLALANTLTSIANVTLLCYALRRKFPKMDFRALWHEGGIALGAALLAALIAGGASWFWEREVGGDSIPERLGAVFVPALVGVLGYGLALSRMRLPAFQELMALVRRRSGKAG